MRRSGSNLSYFRHVASSFVQISLYYFLTWGGGGGGGGQIYNQWAMCDCTGRFLTDLIGNKIVGFHMQRPRAYH